MKITDVKEETRGFLIYDLGISPQNIEYIDVNTMRDGQIRNIYIQITPSINKDKDE